MTADAGVTPPLQKGEFPFTRVAYCLHAGPYDQVQYANGKIGAFIDLNGYEAAGPSIGRYLDMNPAAVRPEELRTEVLLPIRKK